MTAPKVNRPAETFIRASPTPGELGAASRAGGFSAEVVRSALDAGVGETLKASSRPECRTGRPTWCQIRIINAVV